MAMVVAAAAVKVEIKSEFEPDKCTGIKWSGRGGDGMTYRRNNETMGTMFGTMSTPKTPPFQFFFF